MSENILQNIIQKKIEKVDKLKKILNLKTLDDLIDKNKNYINFKKKIENNIKSNKTSIIAEIKKASPSAGIIIDDYNPVDIAQIYLNNKATCQPAPPRRHNRLRAASRLLRARRARRRHRRGHEVHGPRGRLAAAAEVHGQAARLHARERRVRVVVGRGRRSARRDEAHLQGGRSGGDPARQD